MGGECFSTKLGRLCLGDARELIKKLPSESVDAVITDPPWGLGLDEYDDLEPLLEIRDELYRVMKPDSWLVMFFTPKRVYDLAPFTELFEYKWMLVYLFSGYRSVSRNPLGTQAGYSVIMVFAKGRPKVILPRSDVLVADELPVTAEKRIGEPLFKPTYTVATVLSMFTREGDHVLDPFAGYGSVPLVCELFGRRWTAFEIDPLKYKIARKIVGERRVPNIRRLKKRLLEGGGSGD